MKDHVKLRTMSRAVTVEALREIILRQRALQDYLDGEQSESMTPKTSSGFLVRVTMKKIALHHDDLNKSDNSLVVAVSTSENTKLDH
jgi:hypothetical protein